MLTLSAISFPENTSDRNFVFSAADTTDLAGEFFQACANTVQHLFTKLPPILFVDRMKFIHIAGNCVQSHVPVQMIKPADISEEIVLVQKSSDFITLRVTDQLTVLSQFDAFVDTGFDDFNILRIITGMDLRSSSMCIWAITSRPPMFGICRSRRTRSISSF